MTECKQEGGRAQESRCLPKMDTRRAVSVFYRKGMVG